MSKNAARELQKLLEFEETAAQKVFDDALDTYRKRNLDLIEAWNRVSVAQSHLAQAREALVNHPILPA